MNFKNLPSYTTIEIDYKEINCLIEGLTELIKKCKLKLEKADLAEDDRSNYSNDLAYAEVLIGKYNQVREEMAHDREKKQ